MAPDIINTVIVNKNFGGGSGKKCKVLLKLTNGCHVDIFGESWQQQRMLPIPDRIIISNNLICR